MCWRAGWQPAVPCDRRRGSSAAWTWYAGRERQSGSTRTRRSPGRMTARRRTPGAYYRHMGRIIGKILGAILAIWFILTAIGWFSAMLKTFMITGLIVAVVFIVVWLLAGRRRQD